MNHRRRQQQQQGNNGEGKEEENKEVKVKGKCLDERREKRGKEMSS